ncbi:general transcription factor IIF subunit 1 isoform X1 [Ostrinia furnacalis]|uniref:general transcription factor IIF subunit 1 isoform X1 n=1 Tax=Ostrinia furnacalis TaxID=93504 RepID=UPI00103AA2F2|nr:general transcription factor IIF subunit 1 isoform X1 [Ostrinia furnacalis]
MMSAAGSSGAPAAQEFKIRVPKNVNKKYHVMRFNATLNVDFAKWTHVKMERENNIKEFKGIEEEMPKFGAGSEYGRDIREEARRKKFGIISRKYKPEDQPWILKVGGKTGKKFKGIREGGVSENAAYYVFTHAADGAIDAYPLQEWYNFQPIQRYKALSAEEAEQEFGRRNKVLNYFSLMFRKRMRGEEGADDPDEPDEKKPKGAKAKKDLKISEMDEWIDSDDESSDSEAGEKDNDSDSGAKKKKDKKKAAALKKKKKKVNDEAFEESDDGDEEGREKDYISDSSDSESDHETKANKELKGVAEEDALRKLLTSDEDSEEEQEQKAKEEDVQEDEPTKEGEERASKLTKKKKKADDVKKEKESSSDFSSDSDTDPESSNKKPKKGKSSSNDKNGTSATASAPNSASTSRSGTPTPAPSAASAAVAAANAANNAPPSKRPKLDPSYMECGVTEEAVRRYLARKPMTTTELLTKFKSKRTGVKSERLVETMTQILKRINPVKQNINGKMYLSIK